MELRSVNWLGINIKWLSITRKIITLATYENEICDKNATDINLKL